MCDNTSDLPVSVLSDRVSVKQLVLDLKLITGTFSDDS